MSSGAQLDRAARGLRVKLAETPAEWVGAVAVRLAVFVDEQQVPLSQELDEHDRTAVHAVALVPEPLNEEAQTGIVPARSGAAARAAAMAGKFLPLSLAGARGGRKDTGTIAPAVGTGRLMRTGRGARIGRVAVLPDWRRGGVGTRLLMLLEEAARARGVQRLSLHAQVQAVDFYHRLGYAVDPPGTVFQEDGIPHQRMSKRLMPES